MKVSLRRHPFSFRATNTPASGIKNLRRNTSCRQQAFLFSTGGMEADNVLMTYNGTFWEGELPDVWNENGNAAELTVYTPYIDTDPQLFMTAKDSCKISCTTGKIAGKVTGST